MSKQALVTVINCLDCPWCAECGGGEVDRCFNEDSPCGEDCTPIEDVHTIPNWCPLEDV